MRQLVSILVDNALKHTQAGGRVNIILKGQKNKKLLKVSNVGEAIAEEDRDKIFERFYRVDKARSRKEGNYGLGLAIAKAIVERYKGKIGVKCENRVTTFWVLL